MSIIESLFFFGMCVSIVRTEVSNYLPAIGSVTSSAYNRNVSKILRTCFRKNLNPLIVTKKISDQFRQFSSFNQIPLIIIDANLQPQKGYRHYPKLATFALNTNSVQETENIFVILKSSIWWNIDSVFLLVGSNSCNEASAILNSAWEKKLLSAIFVCRHDLNGTVIMYTYNPFTNRAPYPWMALKKISASNGTWTLFERRNVEDEEICKNLVYDKLKYMDGYKLRGLTIPPGTFMRNPNQDYDASTLIKGKIVNVVKFFHGLFAFWNVTVNVNYNEKLNMDPMDYDLLLAFMRLPWYKQIIPTYPLRELFITIGTKKRSFFTTDEKIRSFYSNGAISLICMVFGTVIIALMLNKRQCLFSAILEVIRLMVASGVRQPLTNKPIRIYFFGIFWFLIVINVTFTGHLVKFLTKPERPTIESLSDLQGFKKIFMHPVLYKLSKNEFLSINKSICFHETAEDLTVPLNSSDAALISPSQFSYRSALKYKLHVSKPFGYQIATSGVSPRFPFIKRINEFAFRWSESGLQQFWEYQALYRTGEKLSKIEIIETEFQIRPITINDLFFAFKFFIFGLGCSFIISVIEIVFGSGVDKKINKIEPHLKIDN